MIRAHALHTLSEQGTAYCCGIVCAAQTARQRFLEPDHGQREPEAELCVWLRGPYRGLGIGTEAVRSCLRTIEAEAAFHTSGEKALRRLTVYYPLAEAVPGGGMALQRWMTFFFDQGFRRARQSDTGVGAKFMILKRELGQ